MNPGPRRSHHQAITLVSEWTDVVPLWGQVQSAGRPEEEASKIQLPVETKIGRLEGSSGCRGWLLAGLVPGQQAFAVQLCKRLPSQQKHKVNWGTWKCGGRAGFGSPGRCRNAAERTSPVWQLGTGRRPPKPGPATSVPLFAEEMDNSQWMLALFYLYISSDIISA